MRGRESETGAKVFTIVVPITVIVTRAWPSLDVGPPAKSS
jgi:hypothetical protein